MPIYEYQCRNCGHKLEKLQKISDPPLTDCPACGQHSLRKLVSPVAFRLKGGGWYETDFKEDKSRRNLAKDDDKSADSDTAKTAGDESKTKAKTTEKVTGSASETKTAAQPSDKRATPPAPAG